MTKTRFAFVMIIVLVAVMVISFGDKEDARPEAPKSTAPIAAVLSSAPRSVYPPSPDAEQPTPEQIAFVHSQLFMAWDHIGAYYPLPELRQEFKSFMDRTQVGDVRIRVEPKRFLFGAPPAMATRLNGQLTVVLCVPVWMDIWNEIGERETITDIVVGIMLHEKFHLDHHAGTPPGMITHQQQVENESEAWWYTVEHCYLPMLRAGRLSHLPKDDPEQAITNALFAYKLANGDRRHPAWRNFAASVSPPPH